MKLYIAGPMSGYDGFNYAAFHSAEEWLRGYGYETLNPATNPECDSWDGYMRAALAQVIQSDGIAVLRDWQMSAGATLEVHVAHSLRIPVLAVEQWVTKGERRNAA